jgi:hypothetical protein
MARPPMWVLDVHGPILLDVRDPHDRSMVGAHWSAVGRYLETGDDRALGRFSGQGVTVNTRFYPFITDPDTLLDLADAGVLTFNDIYELADTA